MVTHVAGWVQRTNPSDLGNTTLQAVNQLLARVPFLHVTVSAESLRKAMATVAQKAGEWALHFLQDTAGSLFGASHLGDHLLVRVPRVAETINRNTWTL